VAESATQHPADPTRAGGPLDVALTRPLTGTAVLAVRGELDMLTAPELETALSALLATAEPRLVVDLSAVTFLASRGLATLLRAARRAEESGRALHLVVTSRAVLRPLEVTGSDQLFTLHPDAGAAVSG
jgi:anti-sigma B factor antagonist